MFLLMYYCHFGIYDNMTKKGEKKQIVRTWKGLDTLEIKMFGEGTRTSLSEKPLQALIRLGIKVFQFAP